MMATSVITIRQARPGDLTYLIHLVSDLFAIETDYQQDANRIKTGLTLLTRSPDKNAIFVADDGSRPVGLCTVQLIISTAAGGTSALIEDVIVESIARRQGIGHRLMEAAESWAKIRGAKRVQLLAKTGNTKAEHFYHERNWRPTSMRAWTKPLQSEFIVRDKFILP